MRLSDHFSLSEFEVSNYAERHSIDNTASNVIIARLTDLAVNVLEPLRSKFGPLHISSGYRCEELNEGIGGASSSQHMFGEAADVISHSVSEYELAKWAFENIKEFDQCIYEGRWLHISYSTRHLNRKVPLTAIFKKGQPTRYMNGIVDLANL